MVPLSRGCGSAVLAAMATLAPSRAARSAIESPMPRLAPEMNSVLPLSDAMADSCERKRTHASRTPSRSLAALLPFRPRASRSRIGRAEGTVRRYRNRICRGLAERVDDLVAPVPQFVQHLLGDAAFGTHVIGLPLMMDAGCCDR